MAGSQQEDVDNLGGFLMPVQFTEEILATAMGDSPFLGQRRIIMSSRKQVVVPRFNDRVPKCIYVEANSARCGRRLFSVTVALVP